MDNENECKFWEGFSGDDLEIPFQLIDENGNPEKIGSVDGVTEIVGEFLDGNDLPVRIKLSESNVTIVDSACGRGALNVSAVVSATLKTSATKRQTFTIYVIKNGKKQTWSFDFGLLLKPRPIPA
jgi:hypothetical protein